ncbi:MAG: low molecular weight phosphotyrosine protein phosphatase [Paludibacteraceae bacterium]|nr:low molecular weight phosphotyrosine protein phosphatase [Paludibacteraceae bacterium]
MMKRILFICHGNICRSPMAEFILKDMVHRSGRDQEFHIESAAVSTEEIGNDLYPPAKRKLTEKGVPFTHHAARQITRADYDRFDLIICMDESNLRWMARIIPSDPEHKIRLMMSFAEDSASRGSVRSVADPWYTGDFETTYQDLIHACSGLLKVL